MLHFYILSIYISIDQFYRPYLLSINLSDDPLLHPAVPFTLLHKYSVKTLIRKFELSL